MKKDSMSPVLTLWFFQVVIVLVAFLWSFVNRTSTNHAFACQAFTPLHVSDDLLWLQPIIVSVLFIGILFLIRKTLRWSWGYSALLSLLWTIPFPALYFSSRFYTPPPPTRLVPMLTYWGWDYSIVGSMFIQTNLIVFVAFVAYPIFLLWRNRPVTEQESGVRFWAWTTILPVCFLLSLSPFIVMQVGVYGYVGHYVDDHCQSQISELHIALLRYAEDHENRLPIANDYRELFPQIKPYLKNADADTVRERYDVCVVGYALDRPVRPFEWHKEFSGKEIAYDKRWDYFWHLERKQNPNAPAFCGNGREYFIAGEKWITCPYATERINPSMELIELPGDRFSPEKFRGVP